jgi:hypothetical protein
MDRNEGFRKREQIRGKEATDRLKARVEALRNKQAEQRREKAQQWLR